MALSEQSVDVQVEILRKLPIKDVLRICRTNRHFNNLCQNELDNYFQQLTLETFGIDRKIGKNWYLTILTMYNDLVKMSEMIIEYLPLNEDIIKYVNIKLLRDEIEIIVSEIMKDVMIKKYYRYDEEDYEDDESILTDELFASEYDDIVMKIMHKLVPLISDVGIIVDIDDKYREYGPGVSEIIYTFINKYLPSKITD